ncbi:MAG: ribosome recycling factor [Firmicutes bacterium]|nr:ribosome recycling factor [Bacillota bacterium]
MADEALRPYEDRMNKTIESMESEFNTIRVGRANPHILDNVRVDYYGTETPIGQVGNIAVPEARLLVITPWETAMLKKIEKAIQIANIGINPTNDGKSIRLVFPELTEENRRDKSKDIRKMSENAKVAVRNIRRDGMEAFKKQKKSSDLTEDDYKDIEKEMQELTDNFIKDIDKRAEAKIKEIMTV